MRIFRSRKKTFTCAKMFRMVRSCRNIIIRQRRERWRAASFIRQPVIWKRLPANIRCCICSMVTVKMNSAGYIRGAWTLLWITWLLPEKRSRVSWLWITVWCRRMKTAYVYWIRRGLSDFFWRTVSRSSNRITVCERINGAVPWRVCRWDPCRPASWPWSIRICSGMPAYLADLSVHLIKQMQKILIFNC